MKLLLNTSLVSALFVTGLAWSLGCSEEVQEEPDECTGGGDFSRTSDFVLDSGTAIVCPPAAEEAGVSDGGGDAGMSADAGEPCLSLCEMALKDNHGHIQVTGCSLQESTRLHCEWTQSLYCL